MVVVLTAADEITDTILTIEPAYLQWQAVSKVLQEVEAIVVGPAYVQWRVTTSMAGLHGDLMVPRRKAPSVILVMHVHQEKRGSFV